MASEHKKKIAYLFGAGATHAELFALNQDLVPETEGLLISSVSSRVIENASADANYRRSLETVSATSGSLNIELLISLIENAKISDWEYKAQRLKDLVQEDIQSILTPYRLGRFYLHRALFQLHQRRAVRDKEEVIGLISLNYDDVLDRAYRQQHGEPNYSFTLDADLSPSLPLLKLHGSFNWRDSRIRGRRRAIEIIPLGSAKTYLHAPYVFIWTRALEVLINCDTLRIIGCSLSPNDVHLIDLLFKAHLERKEPFDMEVIDFQDTGETIRRNYGFFPQIKTLIEIENILIPDTRTTNPFKTWLKYKSINMLGQASVRRLDYLRKVLS